MHMCVYIMNIWVFPIKFLFIPGYSHSNFIISLILINNHPLFYFILQFCISVDSCQNWSSVNLNFFFFFKIYIVLTHLLLIQCQRKCIQRKEAVKVSNILFLFTVYPNEILALKFWLRHWSLTFNRISTIIGALPFSEPFK